MGFPMEWAAEFDANVIFDNDGSSLYLGSMESAANLEELEKRNIKKIISVLDFAEPKFSDKVPYLWIKLQDDFDWCIISAFAVAIQQIEDTLILKKDGKNASVLVHCAAGISRSTTIVIAFLMKHLRISFMEAWTITKRGRRFACPNGEFQVQLALWEKIGYKLDPQHP